MAFYGIIVHFSLQILKSIHLVCLSFWDTSCDPEFRILISVQKMWPYVKHWKSREKLQENPYVNFSQPIINVTFFHLLCCRCDPVCRCVGLTFNTLKRSVAVQDVDYNNGSCCPSIVGNKMTSAVCDDIYNLSEQQQQCYPPVSLEQNYPSVAIEQHQQWDPSVASNGQPAEPDSDAEDDPGKLLNAWLGQLNKVNLAQWKCYIPYARHYNPLLIRNCSWILTIHKSKGHST